MKILLVNTTCKRGGVSTFMLSLHRALVAKGHTCELFFLEHGPMEADIPRDTPVHFGSLPDLMRIVRSQHVDVVHANNVDWLSGVSAVRRLGARLIVTAHKARESAWAYGWTTSECDAFVTVSKWLADALQPFTDVAIQVVPNGIDTVRFDATDTRSLSTAPIVAWVGRGDAPRKRLELFAAIAPRLRQEGIRVWVIDPQDPDAFAKAFPDAALALHNAAERWGGVSFEAMPGIYRQVADSGGCVMSTAVMEGMPLAVLEAQSCGCVVVGADVAGVNECVSTGHGGLLFPSQIAACALAEQVVALLRDRDDVRLRQRLCRDYVRTTFSLERMAERYLNIYSDVPVATGPLATCLRALGRALTVVNSRDYVRQRWGVGFRQYEVALELAAAGEWPIARAAARASLEVAPTLYWRPRRLATLLQCSAAGRSFGVNRRVARGPLIDLSTRKSR